MHCNSCERLVSDALAAAGATDVVANHETGVVTYAGELSDDAVAEAVTKAGFTLA
jgi:copper chaperone CopZ